MGACASRFSFFKSAENAPLPSPKEEEVVSVSTSREVNLEEQSAKKDDEPAAVDDDEAKSQSLGHLLKENEKPKLEDATEVNPKDAPAKVETESAKEKPAETVKVETPAKVETVHTEKPEDKKSETVEIKIIEEHVPVAKPVQKIEAVEEKVTVQTAKLDISEKKLDISETKITEDSKPAVVTKIEPSQKVEDKQVLGLVEKEKPVEKKADEKTVVKDKN